MRNITIERPVRPLQLTRSQIGCMCLLLLIAQAIPALSLDKTTYVQNGDPVCTENADGERKWVTRFKCTSECTSGVNIKFKAAVLSHDDWGAPDIIKIKINDGSTLVLNGTTIELEANQAAANEAETLYGSDAGYTWHGFVSTESFLTMIGVNTAKIKVTYGWTDNAPYTDKTGEAWFSDDADDNHGLSVTDYHVDFGAGSGLVSRVVNPEDSANILQQHPNPVSDNGKIVFNIKQNAAVVLDIVTQTGHSLVTLVNDRRTAGEHTVNYQTEQLPPGMYFTRLRIGAQTFVRKLQVVK